MRRSPAKSTLQDRAEEFRARLLPWYDENARDLPWRRSRDPYHIWLSEIMLQQTRVAAVIEHYDEFLRRFPTVEKLAAARESSVLAAWSGLGYYRRARMLHAAAKIVTRKLDGRFPETAERLRHLPGIGRYTSAAIASIAFGEPVAVVDGNVERVLQRVSGKVLPSSQLWQIAEDLLDRSRPGDFNQAMMELGAMVCTPRAPACLMCPIVRICATRGEVAGAVEASRQRKCDIHYGLECRSEDRGDVRVFLVQRPRNAALMPGMWELPEIPPPAEAVTPAFEVKHSITVTDYTVHVWRSRTSGNGSGRWIAQSRIPKLALTGLARKVLRRAGLWHEGCRPNQKNGAPKLRSLRIPRQSAVI